MQQPRSGQRRSGSRVPVSGVPAATFRSAGGAHVGVGRRSCGWPARRSAVFASAGRSAGRAGPRPFACREGRRERSRRFWCGESPGPAVPVRDHSTGSGGMVEPRCSAQPASRLGHRPSAEECTAMFHVEPSAGKGGSGEVPLRRGPSTVHGGHGRPWLLRRPQPDRPRPAWRQDQAGHSPRLECSRGSPCKGRHTEGRHAPDSHAEGRDAAGRQERSRRSFRSPTAANTGLTNVISPNR